MTDLCKKSMVAMCLVIVFAGLMAAGGVASGAVITVDSKDDAGLFPGQGAYLWFLDSGDQTHAGPATDPHWTSYGGPGGVNAWADAHGIPGPWLLQSAGSVWADDAVVGETLTGLAAGTYRITPTSGAFAYSFEDTPPYDGYWWQLHILAHNVYVNGQLEDSASWILGSTTPFESASAALQASIDEYLDITLAEGGALEFWIWDVNSIDNSGGLAFNVAPVPWPSPLVLIAAVGLAALARRLDF